MATTRGNQEILQRVVQCFRTGTAAGPFSDSDLTDTDACAVQYNIEGAGSYLELSVVTFPSRALVSLRQQAPCYVSTPAVYWALSHHWRMCRCITSL